jgi:hypothetical protein
MKLKYLFIPIFAVIAVMIASAFKGDSVQGTATGGYYRYEFTADTITNAELDTLTLPVNLYSDYTFDYQVTRTNVSGTSKITIYLQESNLTSGNTDWITIDSIGTSNSGATPGRITGDHVYGVRHRLIFDGGGTHATKYTCMAMLKRVN